MPCPHCKITIIKRSNNESAVSAAAYQSGEKLFSEYDQEQKYYPYKNEVTHKEIMLPPHVPPEFADRNTLWNSAEAQEKQWNSQLARRFVLAIPREIPPGQYADLIRDYCREFFCTINRCKSLEKSSVSGTFYCLWLLDLKTGHEPVKLPPCNGFHLVTVTWPPVFSGVMIEAFI